MGGFTSNFTHVHRYQHPIPKCNQDVIQATALENLLESDSDEEDDGYKIQTRERNRKQREILIRRRERGRRKKKDYPSFEEGEVEEEVEEGEEGEERRRRRTTTRESIQSCSSIDSNATFGEHHSRYPLADDQVSEVSEYETESETETESESDEEGGRRSRRRRRRRKTTSTTKKDPFVTTVTGGDIDHGTILFFFSTHIVSTHIVNQVKTSLSLSLCQVVSSSLYCEIVNFCT